MLISNHQQFFVFLCRNISFFRYFWILICNRLWTIFLCSLWSFPSFSRNFITKQIASCFCCFLNWSFWSSLKCMIADFLAWWRSFRLRLPITSLRKLLLIFFTHILSKIQKFIAFCKYPFSRLNWISRIFYT